MAEHVQAALDAMILPLLDLQERQIFSPDEIRAIVQRRRESEYLLRRRNARKSDYVSYLQNEMQLERLRALRSKQQKKKQRLLASSSAHERIQQQQTKHVGDKHVLQHILLLWTRTMRKFRGDLGLWLQYLEFLKQHGRHQRLSAAYAQALQLHPRATGLWVEASSWELFEQSSVDSARVLLQRGLRLNPSSRELWLHFFRLEMHVVQKLAGRKLLLQLGDGTTSQKDEPSESPFANHSDNNSIDDGSAKKNDPYSLARVVLDHAAHALAKKNENELLGLYSDCLQSCRSFPYTQGLQRHLLHQLRRRGPNTVASWMAQIAWIRNNPGIPFVDDSDDEPDAKRVRLMTSKIGQPVERPLVHLRDPVLKLLRLATQELPTEAMYREAIRFLGRYLQQKDEEPDNKEDDDGKNDEQSTAESDEGGMLLDALWREARASDFFSSALVLEYADYHLDKRQYEDRAAVEVAVNVLQDFVEGYSNSSSGGGGGGGGGTHMVSAAVWTRLAQLQSVSRATPSDESVATLRRGLEQTPPYQTDHLVLLLHLFGALLARSAGKAPSELWILLDRILLLYPGFITKMEDVPDPPFGIRNVPEACLEFQQHVANEQGLDWTRRLYEKLLFRSGLVELLRQCPEMVHYIEGIVDQAVTAEARCAIPKERRKNLLRILEFAVRHAPSTSSKERYLAAKENLQFSALSTIEPSPLSKGTLRPKIPSFDASSSTFLPSLLRQAYDVYQIVHLRNVPTMLPTKGRLSWKDLGSVFQGLDREDRKSWCVENHDADDRGPVIDPVDFLSSAECDARAYCSFLIQNDRDSFDRVVARFPVPEFGWDDELVHERAVWIFFGRNPVGNPELDGRPDHTDSVSHDGTWHYQLSGKKEWNLRPSSGLLRHFDRILPRRATSEGWTPEELRLTVMCSERDVLMVNTRLWFHRTRIPAQRVPSVSFARDFRFPSDDDDADADDAEGQVADDGGQEAEPGGMSNLDGLYARADIDEGTVIFTETDMPDAELHVSSSDPNCQVVTLEDGGSAVVSRRLIRAGEFFCVPESPSDEDDDSDDDDEYDNDCGHGEDDDDKADDEDGGADED